MTEPIPIESVLYLELQVYVIGYYPQGECILILVFDTYAQSVRKSILIDCYSGKKQKQLRNILDEKGVSSDNPLDLFIWTHPDEDHSLGIRDIVENYTGSETIMVMPDGVSIWTLIRKRQLLNYVSILERFKKNKLQLERVNSSNNREDTIKYLSCAFIDPGRDPIKFNIEVLTPYADDAIRSTEIKKNAKKNEVSISALLHFGGLHLYFGGDVEDAAITKVPLYKMNGVSFVKIPHHGSDTSIMLPKRIVDSQEDADDEENTQVTSVSTCYHVGGSNLPLDEVLELYCDFSQKICLTDMEQNRCHTYGIWEYKYAVVAQNMVDQSYGDAGVWVKSKMCNE